MNPTTNQPINELERLKSFIDVLTVWAAEKEDLISPVIGEYAEQMRDIEA